jgi:hypothetical protein
MRELPSLFMIVVALLVVGAQFLLTSSTLVQGVVTSALSLHSLLTWPVLSLSVATFPAGTQPGPGRPAAAWEVSHQAVAEMQPGPSAKQPLEAE